MSPIKKTKKQIKAEEDAINKKKLHLAALQWGREHRVRQCNVMDQEGLVKIPIDWLIRTTEQMAAKLHSIEQVNNIVQSIRDKGVNPKRFVVVCFKDELEQLNINLDNPQLDIEADAPPFRLHVIAGNHTFCAIQFLHCEKPNYKEYKHLYVELWIISEVEEDFLQCRHNAQLDNSTKSLGTDATIWDNMKIMHDNIVRIRETEGVYGQPAVTKQIKLMKASNTSNFAQKETTLGTMWSLAQLVGPIWDKMEQIMQGNVSHRKNKSGKLIKFSIPTSANAFKSMSGIPDNEVLEWMDLVIAGKWELKEFNVACLNWKKSNQVQKNMVSYIHTIRTEACKGMVSYDDLAVKYKFLIDKDWFDSMTRACMNMLIGEGLATTVKTEIRRRIEEAEKQEVYNNYI